MKYFIQYLYEKFIKCSYIKSLNIIGSSHRENNIKCDDEIDIYLLVDKLTPERKKNIENVLRRASYVFKRDILLENRRGPFRSKDGFQIHLIIDDQETILSTSAITIADWAANSINIFGKEINDLVDKYQLKTSYKRELQKTLRMLSSGTIQYKEWVEYNGASLLLPRTKTKINLKEFLELLKYSYKAMISDYTALRKYSPSPHNDKINNFIQAYKANKLCLGDLTDMSNLILGWNRDIYSTM